LSILRHNSASGAAVLKSNEHRSLRSLMRASLMRTSPLSSHNSMQSSTVSCSPFFSSYVIIDNRLVEILLTNNLLIITIAT